MSWAVGFDSNWQRDIGYGVPAICDQPGCGAEIDRGLSYVCGDEPFGGEHGCGLYFCGVHRGFDECDHVFKDDPAYEPSPDTEQWIHHKLTHPSWQQWREENPAVAASLLVPLKPKEPK